MMCFDFYISDIARVLYIFKKKHTDDIKMKNLFTHWMEEHMRSKDTTREVGRYQKCGYIQT